MIRPLRKVCVLGSRPFFLMCGILIFGSLALSYLNVTYGGISAYVKGQVLTLILKQGAGEDQNYQKRFLKYRDFDKAMLASRGLKHFDDNSGNVVSYSPIKAGEQTGGSVEGYIEEPLADQVAPLQRAQSKENLYYFNDEPVYLLPKDDGLLLVRELFRGYFQRTFKPEVRGGQTVGLLYSGNAEYEVLESLGMQPGDIVKSVNGQFLANDTDFSLVVPGLKAQWADIIIERDGQEVTFSVALGR